jgi:hypothetical protein
MAVAERQDRTVDTAADGSVVEWDFPAEAVASRVASQQRR